MALSVAIQADAETQNFFSFTFSMKHYINACEQNVHRIKFPGCNCGLEQNAVASWN